MATRQYYSNESLSEVSNTNSATWTDLVSLTFTPDASKDYIIFWSGAFQIDSTSQSVFGRVYDGSSGHDEFNLEAKEASSPIDYNACGGFFRYQSGGSPSSMTFTLQVRRSGASGTAKAKGGRLIALRLETGDVYAESLSSQNTTSTTPVDAVSTGALANSAYAFFAAGSLQAALEAEAVGVFNTTTDVNWTYAPRDENNWAPFLIANAGTISSTSEWKLQYDSVGGFGAFPAAVKDAKVLALLQSGFDNVYASTPDADNSGTNTSYTDTNVTQTFTPAATPHLAVAAWSMEGTSTTISNYMQFVDNGSSLQELIREPNATTGGWFGAVAAVSTYAASSRTQKLQRKSETGSTTTYSMAGSAIVTLDLGGGSTDVTANPGAGSLALTGLSPTVAAGASVAPAAGALTLTGLTPTVAANYTAAPAAGALTLTGLEPTITADATVSPSAGALTLTGLTPDVSANYTATPDPGSLILTGLTPTVTAESGNITVTPDPGALTLTGLAPTVSASVTVAPATGALALTGFIPGLSADVVVDPDAGALALTGLTPDVSADYTAEPGVGSLTLTGLTPAVAADATVAPSPGSLTLTGFAASVSVSYTAEPDAGSLTLTGLEPAVTSAVTVTPATGALVLTGFAPTVSVGVAVSPGAGSLALTGFAPAVALAVSPGVGSLTLTGLAPSLVATAGYQFIPTILNLQQLQSQANSIFEFIYDAMPGYGASLPDANGQVEGRIFVVTPANTKYQLQAGVWVTI